jgi:outer membrane beta-barrel protein
MESRIRVLLLSVAATLLCGCASLHLHRHARTAAGDNAPGAATTPAGSVSSQGNGNPADAGAGGADQNPPAVIEPQVQRRTVKVPRIRSSNVELGVYYGELSIENFGTQPVEGARLDYHVTEDFFFEGSYGQARAGQTSFELLSGGVQLLSSAERRFTYYNLSLGYNMLPGEIFIGHDRAMTSALYLIGGIGDIKFAGDQNFSVNFGAGFRVLPTDWLALHIDVQDLVYRTHVFSVYQLTNNLQATIGASVFF